MENETELGSLHLLLRLGEVESLQSYGLVSVLMRGEGGVTTSIRGSMPCMIRDQVSVNL